MNDELLVKHFERIESRFDAVDKRFDRVEKRLDTVDKRLDRVDARLDQVDKRLDIIDCRLEAHDQKFESINYQFESVNHQFEAVNKQFESVNQRFDSIEAMMKTAAEDRHAMKLAMLAGFQQAADDRKDIRAEMRGSVKEICQKIDGFLESNSKLEKRVTALEDIKQKFKIVFSTKYGITVIAISVGLSTLLHKVGHSLL
jgi:predicted  nucleic acid-binding Zn-ribbon protein